MSVIAGGIAAILTMVALLHFAWGIGSSWPAVNRRQLAQSVVGSAGKEMPPNAATLLVAALIFSAGLVPLAWLYLPEALGLRAVLRLAMLGLSGIFLLRGLASYTRAFQRLLSVEPFSTLNKRYYGPLCLMLGAGYVSLAVFAE